MPVISNVAIRLQSCSRLYHLLHRNWIDKLKNKRVQRPFVLYGNNGSIIMTRPLSVFHRNYSSLDESQSANSEDYDTTTPEINIDDINKNPRSIELLGFNKPRGFGMQLSQRCFYNRLNFTITNRHIKASVEHHTGTIMVSASTQDFDIGRYIYKSTDMSAAQNIGRVIADRCKEVGIPCVYWRPRGDNAKERVRAFARAVMDGGIALHEPKRKIHPHLLYPADRSNTGKRKPKKKKHKYMTRSMKRWFT